MKHRFVERDRQYSGVLRSQKNRYLRKGVSPDPSTSFKSNQELFSQVIPHFSNHRNSENFNKVSSRKFNKKTNYESEMYSNFDGVGVSDSSKYLGEKRKKQPSAYHKKIVDAPMNSEAFFTNNKTSTKEASKVSLPPSESYTELAEQGA